MRAPRTNKDAIANLLSYTWGGERALSAERIASIQGDVEQPGCSLPVARVLVALEELAREGRVLRVGSKYRLAEAPETGRNTA